jgi:ADP-ribose pyrophosphatase YjhB (NUDIX family)
MTADKQPEIQLISNLIVVRDDGRVLFVRNDPDDERWWLPGEDLEPYEHPDERATKELERFGLKAASLEMMNVDSFRGRRGWHVVFHYLARVTGDPKGPCPAEWFSPEAMPPTAHGRWEQEAVRRVLAAGKP